MTLPRILKLNEYQDMYPPLHQMVAAWMGVKPTDKADSTNAQALEEFLKKNDYKESDLDNIKMQTKDTQQDLKSFLQNAGYSESPVDGPRMI